MRISRIGHFAANNPHPGGALCWCKSPTREKRECGFADGEDPNNQKIPPPAPTIPQEQPAPSEAIPSPQGPKSPRGPEPLDISHGVRANVLGSIPEVVLTVPERILRSPAIIETILAGNFLAPEQRRWLSNRVREWRGDRFSENTSVEEQLFFHLHEASDEERTSIIKALRPLVQDILKEPESVWKLCHAYEGTYLARLKEFLDALRGAFGPLNQIPTIDLERIFLFEQTELARRGMGFTQWLETAPPEELSKFFDIPRALVLERRAHREDLDADQETKRTLQALEDKDSYVTEADRDASGNATSENIGRRAMNQFGKLTRTWKTLQGFLRWGERDSTQTTPEELIEKLERESNELRILLDHQLKQRAQLTLNQMHARLERATTGTLKRAEDVTARYGVSVAALLYQKANIRSPLDTILEGDITKEGLEQAQQHFKRIEEAEEDLKREHAEKILEAEKNAGLLSEQRHRSFFTEEGMLTDEGWLYAHLRKERQDHTFAMETLAEFAQLWDQAQEKGEEDTLTLLKELLPPDEESEEENLLAVARRVRSGNLTPEDHEYIYERIVDGAPRIRGMLTALRYPTARGQFLESRNLASEQPPDLRGEDANRAWDELASELESAASLILPHGKLCRYLEHPIGSLMPIREGIEAQIEKARQSCVGRNPRDMTTVRWTIKKLNESYQQLAHLRVEELEGPQYKEKSGTLSTPGCYHLGDGMIYLNRNKVSAARRGLTPPANVLALREQTIVHERGHAILDILTRRTGLLSGLLVSVYAQMRDECVVENGQKRTFGEMLEAQAQTWHIPVKKGHEQFHDYLIDELLSKYASWVSQGKPQLDSPALRSLFASLERNLSGTVPQEAQEPARELALQSTDFPSTPEDEGSPAASAATEPSLEDVNQNVRDFKILLHEINEFLKAHPEARSMRIHTSSERISPDRGPTLTLAEDYRDLDKFFLEHIEHKLGSEGYTPKVRENIELFKKREKQWKEFLQKVQNESFGKVYSTPTRSRSVSDAFFQDWQLISLKNIWGVAKSIGEDWMRMWKRRGEKVEAKFGKLVTRWIPDQIPYAGRLKHEFHRRDQQSELEEVRLWRDSFKNLDSFHLQARLGDKRVRNEDEIKAIFEELSERGRLDWNDTRVWEKLNKLSRYAMPIEPCVGDDVLRDKWLQKLITDIWGDKDLFFNWRRANDSGFKSGKEKFTPTADQLSNLRDGLGSELERQLRLWLEYKERRKVDRTATPDQQVNPHLYEELIHYSIRNGKMSMEQKFYYLIRGVAEGLLSIDRLRVLAGEGGDVLMLFPFIDYFYQKNNDPAFMRNLNERIKEKDKKGRDTCRPGARIMMFVRLEIAREKSVKERLRKAQSKMGDKIDHDDIPWFLPELDHTNIDDWYTMAGGRRLKLSFEAVKNSYVGFSMKFKALSALSQMDGGHRFSDSDFENLIDTIGGYILSDNILTRNGFTEVGQRPKLSPSEINNTKPVWGHTNLVSYRNPLNDFARDIARLLDGTPAWSAINTKINATGDTRVTSADVFTAGREIGRNIGNEVLAKNIHIAVDPFLDELKKLTRRDPAKRQALLQILVRYGREFTEDQVLHGIAPPEKFRKDQLIAFMQQKYRESMNWE